MLKLWLSNGDKICLTSPWKAEHEQLDVTLTTAPRLRMAKTSMEAVEGALPEIDARLMREPWPFCKEAESETKLSGTTNKYGLFNMLAATVADDVVVKVEDGNELFAVAAVGVVEFSNKIVVGLKSVFCTASVAVNVVVAVDFMDAP